MFSSWRQFQDVILLWRAEFCFLFVMWAAELLNCGPSESGLSFEAVRTMMMGSPTVICEMHWNGDAIGSLREKRSR